MPGKARRVASRQAQLNRKRKRQQRGPTGIPAAATEPPPQDGQATDDGAIQAPEPAAPAASSQAAAPAGPTPARPGPATGPRGVPRARREATASVNYVGAELRRILIMAGLILSVLIVLAILL